MSHPPIIFLDLDGVLAPVQMNHGLDSGRLDLLQCITEKTGAAVVVSSTWRKVPEQLKRIFSELAVRGIPYAGETPILDSPAGTGTLHTNVERHLEITEWLTQHPLVKRYIILDDEPDADDGRGRFIKTNSRVGLTAKLAQEAIELINAQ